MAQMIGPAFGRGSKGNLVITSNIAWSSVSGIINTSCSGTVLGTSLTVTDSTGFTDGTYIIIHHSRGVTGNTGGWEINVVKGTPPDGTTINVAIPLSNTYTDSAADQSQVQTFPDYSHFGIATGVALTAGAWDGNKGGIIGFFCSGRSEVVGSISASGKGFLGGAAIVSASNTTGFQGEGTAGAGSQTVGTNGNGGSGGKPSAGGGGGGASGGGYGAAGSNGVDGETGGLAVGEAAITSLIFGGGGGSGGCGSEVRTSGAGGNGGGAIVIISKEFFLTGAMASTGSNGGNWSGSGANGAGGGSGGAGGPILIKTNKETGANLISSTGGSGGDGEGAHDGVSGAVGRIRIESLNTLSGTSSPAASSNIGSSNSWAGKIGLIG